jgi:hypothetical protein
MPLRVQATGSKGMRNCTRQVAGADTVRAGSWVIGDFRGDLIQD